MTITNITNATPAADYPTEQDPKPTRNRSAAVMAGGAGMIVGAFLPWVTMTAPMMGQVSRSGMDNGGDGIVFLVVGALVALWGFTRFNTPTKVRFQGLMGWTCAGAIAIAAFEYSHITKVLADVTEDSELITATVGSGVFLVAFSAIVALIAIATMPSRTA